MNFQVTSQGSRIIARPIMSEYDCYACGPDVCSQGFGSWYPLAVASHEHQELVVSIIYELKGSAHWNTLSVFAQNDTIVNGAIQEGITRAIAAKANTVEMLEGFDGSDLPALFLLWNCVKY
ncbi:hypothetical protein FA15DRAFT_702038 [Coprinopsis marcescibilis]|uniref:Uncharacterized protein n=1 Tax=Coprinopsis marcescibilis TaxID=230819 RepID=A0A5C3LFF1_COPMA|nr:hypothetical protein FA15DRAFT_702038 [Coprinopsis marcescibilis]